MDTPKSFLNERRQEYLQAPLDEGSLASDPIAQFEHWYKQAQETEPFDATAAVLATASAQGVPSARTILLKAFTAEGFVFYTNYNSRKSQELMANPHAALVFFWSSLHRQVCVEGSVTKVSAQESDAYFRTRPRGSQVGAWASPQSEVIDKEQLEANFTSYEQRFAQGEVPRPPHWGGFRLCPQQIIFWQGRPNRLHDRFIYRRQASGWRVERLAP